MGKPRGVVRCLEERSKTGRKNRKSLHRNRLSLSRSLSVYLFLSETLFWVTVEVHRLRGSHIVILRRFVDCRGTRRTPKERQKTAMQPQSPPATPPLYHCTPSPTRINSLASKYKHPPTKVSILNSSGAVIRGDHSPQCLRPIVVIPGH